MTTPVPTATTDGPAPRAGVGHRVARILVLAGAMALLAGEYYMWREHAADPASLVFLAAMYIGFAITVESLTTRFAWSPATTALFGVLVGTVLEGFFQRSFMADEPRILGVNWITVAVMAVYWGVLTTALARYAADRVLPRASYAPPRTRRGLFGIAAWWVALLFVWGANLGPLPDSGVVATGVLAAAELLLLIAVGRRRDDRPARALPRKRTLDVAIVVYIAIEFLVGTAVADVAARVVVWIIIGTLVGIIAMWTLMRRKGSEQASQEA
ncbi:MAG TPA: hypothetical protein VF902_02875 [Coriobacteriia bacterium]